jgi:glycosyltransferase involved in cell wall biosynthesis
LPANIFIFGQVNRNQSRKRVDLLLFAFAEFLKQWDGEGPEPYLLLHMNPHEQNGYDLPQLGAALGIQDHLLFTAMRQARHGTGEWTMQDIPDTYMPLVYSAMDVQINTSVGEGFSLPTMEGMACGVPQILPLHSALAEWAADAALFVSCSTHWTTPNGVNTIGRVMDVQQLVFAMQEAYCRGDLRQSLREKGLALVAEPRFSWDTIAGQFDTLLRQTIAGALDTKASWRPDAHASTTSGMPIMEG